MDYNVGHLELTQCVTSIKKKSFSVIGSVRTGREWLSYINIMLISDTRLWVEVQTVGL